MQCYKIMLKISWIDTNEDVRLKEFWRKNVILVRASRAKKHLSTKIQRTPTSL